MEGIHLKVQILWMHIMQITAISCLVGEEARIGIVTLQLHGEGHGNDMVTKMMTVSVVGDRDLMECIAAPRTRRRGQRDGDGAGVHRQVDDGIDRAMGVVGRTNVPHLTIIVVGFVLNNCWRICTDRFDEKKEVECTMLHSQRGSIIRWMNSTTLWDMSECL